MIYEIEPELIIVNLLKKYDTLTVKQINDCKIKIKNKFPNETIIIDASSSAICFAVERNSYLFK